MIAHRYEVREWIGQGGMGTVYRGIDRETGGVVAIKQLRLEQAGRDPAGAERFRREGEALARLNHPNIVRILATAREEGVDYLVMEYVGGGSLEDLLLATESPLPIERVLRIALDLCDALSRTHRLDIVHRDIKPSNVLLAEDGTPRLTDFGAAYVESKERITMASAIVGTTEYLSPEALRGEAVDARVDIWSFGVLLFEMLTRQRPFAQKSVAQTLHSIIFSSPPDLTALRPDCPPALVDLIYRMLAKNREQRVPTARQVAAELEDILQGRSRRPLPVTAPPVVLQSATARAVRNNLSCETATFVGRQPELTELLKRLEDRSTRLITIIAPGGMGKTRLAVELGHRLVTGAIASEAAAQGFRFAHGVFLVQLAPLSSADFIASAIAEAVGLQFYAGREPKQQLCDHFREKRALLLLDNFEHVLSGATLVHDLLQSAPGLTVVATSRERLSLMSETLFPLSGMELPDPEAPRPAVDSSAVRLFVQGARQQKPNFRLEVEDVPHVIRICRLVEGVPLGIVLAASWAGSLSLSEIGDEISRGLDFLAAELRDLPERQRSMRAVFDHSWTLLNAHEQSVLSGLSVFRGGFTRDAAQRVAAADVQVLAALMNKSLVRRELGSGRYETHELLRQYAEEKLKAGPGRHGRAMDAHSSYFASCLHDRERALKGPEPRQALVEIETELDNVRAAWAHLLASGDIEKLALCMEALHVFHTHRASFGEGESTFGALADSLRGQTSASSEHARVFARALSMQAAFLRQLGRYAHAERLLEESLAQLDATSHPRESAFALVVAGSTKTKTGNLEQGRLLAERGLALYRTTDDTYGLATTLETLGRIYGTSGDFTSAERAFRESTLVQRTTGMLQSGLMGLGVATVQQGNYALGCRMMLDALEMFEKAGDVWNKMRCQMNLANTQRNLGNYASAEAYARSCLAFWQEVGNWDHEAWCYFQLGNIFKEQGLYEAAQSMYETGYARSVQAGDAGKIALAQLEFGGIALTRGDWELAEHKLSESLRGFESSGQTWGVALAHDLLAYLACHRSQWESAESHFRRALGLAVSLRLYPFAANTIAGIAVLYAQTGRSEQALELVGLVQHHAATERHTLTRRVAPLLRELQSTVPQEVLEAALERGKQLDLRSVGDRLANPPASEVA